MPRYNRRKFLQVGATAITGLVSYSSIFELYNFGINEYVVYLDNLPKAFHGYRIAHLSDIHHRELMPLSQVERIVKSTNEIGADAIVCTGDYVSERDGSGQIKGVWPVLKKLKAKDGVFSVLGNHDHWANTKLSLEYLEASGQSVRHKSVEIKKGSQSIWIGGGGDYWADENGVDKAFEGVPSSATKLLLIHNPDSLDLFYDTKIDFAFCGHTHGGQIRIPFVGALALPLKNTNYGQGMIQSKLCPAFVSRGLGWSIIPIRFNCPAEIAVVTLRRA